MVTSIVNYLPRIRIYFFLAFLLILLFISCEKVEKDGTKGNLYLTDYKLKATIQPEFLSILFSSLSLQYPEANDMAEDVKYPVDLYVIQFKTHYGNREIIASGLLCVPGAAENFPIISFQNGTNTLHSNAPSINYFNSLYLIAEGIASQGFIMLIPDYIGFGSSSDIVHPYYQIESSNNAIIDMMYAAGEFFDNNSSAAGSTDDYFLMGYSQGGWATLAVLNEIEKEETFNIIATSCGAGAYSLIGVSEYILAQDSFPGPLYLPYYIYSHQEYGSITDPLNVFFDEPYASSIPALFDGSLSNSEVNSHLTTSISNLLKPGFLSGFASSAQYAQLRSDLIHNSVVAWQVTSKLRFYHGTTDKNVPPSESQHIYSDFLNLGMSSKVEYFELEGLDHAGGIVPWGIRSIEWFKTINR